MPIYEYVCQQCHQEQEQLVRGDTTIRCEACGSDHLQKLLSVPVAHGHAAHRQTADPGSPGPPPGPCGSGCGCFPG